MSNNTKEVENEEIIEEIIEDDPIELDSEGVEGQTEGSTDSVSDALGSDKDDIPEEAKPDLHKGQKKKTQKRIISLHKKVKDLESKLERVSKAEYERAKKELQDEKDKKFQQIVEKQQKAFDDGNMAKVAEANVELANLNNQVEDNDPNFDIESYFSSQFAWYNVDERKTNNAISVDAKLRNDPYWSSRPVRERLNEVGRQTNELFKGNPYRNSSPSEGAPMSGGSSARSTLSISREKLNLYERMYPGKSRQEILKIAKDHQSRIAKRGREDNA